MSKIRQVAYHETGHAIACIELNVQFDAINIVPGRGFAGGVSAEGDDGFWLPPDADPNSPENVARYWAWAHEQAVIDYAGHAALVALLGIGDMGHRSAVAHGAGHDYTKARLRLCGKRQLMAKDKARAIEIVTRRRDDIENVVAIVLKSKRLDAQRVQYILYDETP